MLRAVVAVTMTVTTLALVENHVSPVVSAADLAEDFEGVAVGSDPVGWVDTAADNSLSVDDSLFEVMAAGGSQVLGTTSRSANIHSHHEGGAWSASSEYTYTGRMMMSDPSSSVGVTFFSDYVQSDSYYRLRRYGSGGSFHLSPHGTSITGGSTDTGVVQTVDVWYQFEVEVADTGSQTEVRARVWEEGTTKPTGWQIDAFDSSAARLTSGTIGVWAYSNGAKYFDYLTVSALAAPGPHTLTLSATGQGSVAANPDLVEYVHGTSVDVTATPDAGWEFTGWSGDLTGTTNPATPRSPPTSPRHLRRR